MQHSFNPVILAALPVVTVSLIARHKTIDLVLAFVVLALVVFGTTASGIPSAVVTRGDIDVHRVASERLTVGRFERGV